MLLVIFYSIHQQHQYCFCNPISILTLRALTIALFPIYAYKNKQTMQMSFLFSLLPLFLIEVQNDKASIYCNELNVNKLNVKKCRF